MVGSTRGGPGAVPGAAPLLMRASGDKAEGKAAKQLVRFCFLSRKRQPRHGAASGARWSYAPHSASSSFPLSCKVPESLKGVCKGQRTSSCHRLGVMAA